MKKIIFLLSFFALLQARQAFAQPSYIISPAQLEVNEDDNFCLDLRVQDFTSMISVQFTVKFDQTVFQFVNISNINSNVAGLDITDFGTSTSGLGYITFVWSDGQPCQSAVTGEDLPDDAVLFTMCFKAIGQYGTHSPFTLTNSPIDMISRRATAQCFDIGEDYVGNGFVSIGTSPLKINIGSANGNTGETVCVDFKVEDFQNLISMQYYIFYDASVLEFQSATKMNLGTTGDQYDIFHNATYNMIATSWYNNNINVGKDLADGTQILQVCFKIIGNCGQTAPIYISNNPNSSPPEPIEIIDEITSDPNDGTNIGLLTTPGEVIVNCVDPDGITINMADRNVCPGETFTIDVKVEDFSQIAQLMFDLKWNPGVIEYQGVTYPVQPGSNCLPFANGFDDSQAAAPLGLIHMDWSTQSQGCNKPDGYILFRLTFKVVGPSGSSTNIAVVDPIFVDKFGGAQPANIGINSNNSFVSVCQLSSPTIVASSVNANPGSNVCIDFTVQDFNDITNMGYTLNWEPTILQFTGLQGFNLPGLNQSNFTTSQAANFGVIGVDWANAIGESVSDGISLFTACFNVIGEIDSCSVVSLGDSPWPIDIQSNVSNATSVGLNVQPGQVCVTNPFTFNLAFPDVYSGQYSSICVDVTVDNFNQLTNTEYAITWNPDILTLEGFNTLGALPSFTASNVDDSDIDDGNLIIDWAAASQVLGTSLPDGTAILELCFHVEGESGECSQIYINNTAFYPTQVTSATTGNTNLDLGYEEGSICVSGSMNLASYTITDVSCGGTPNGAIDITVQGGSGQFSYNWTGPCANPTTGDQTNLCVGNYVVTITDVNNTTLKIIQPFNISYTPDATFANAGQDTARSCNNFELVLNGSASSTGPNTTYFWRKLGAGQVIAGQDSMMNPLIIGTGCFELTVSSPGCIDKDTVCVSGTQTPIPTIRDSIEQLSCKTDTLILDGTLSPFGFPVNWIGPGVVAGTETFLTPKVTLPGIYILEMTNTASNCIGRDTIEVFGSFTEPNSDAGTDENLGCDITSAPLGGPMTSTGADFIYDWVPIGSGQICGNPQSPNINACSAGTFQLTVTDTLNGCSAMDTVVVSGNTDSPTADAGLPGTIDCSVLTVTLDGSASSPGMEYTWTNVATGSVVSQGTLIISVTSPGTYRLEVKNPMNNCKAIDEVVVVNGANNPGIATSSSNPIDCSVTTSTLSGIGSATGTNISYAWLNSAGMQIGTTIDVTVTQPGDYTMVVTNADNACSSTSTVTVVDNSNQPAANAGQDKELTCDLDEVQLDGTYDSTNPDLTPQWIGPGLQCLQNGSTATATASCSGFYIFQVVDIVTGCVGKDTVEVKSNKVPPVANAGNDDILPCAGSSLQLNGSTNISDFTVTWSSLPAGLPMTNATTLMPTVTQPGTYVLSITSNINCCTDTAEVVVTTSNTNLQANAGPDDEVDCINTTITLNASGSSPGVTYLWEQIVGGSFTSDQVSVDVEAGTYLLTVTGTGNCQDIDTVIVTNIAVDISVEATASGFLSCDNQEVELQGNIVTGPSDMNLVWKDANGFIIGNGPTVTVTTPGVYTWEASDSNSGCASAAEVTVSMMNDSLEPASAQADYTECASEATLTGNLPPNTTGEWKSLSGATITDITAATTTATGLLSGENVFIWSLSIGDCKDYSSDSATINVDLAAPNAVNDNAELTPTSGGELTLNVLENDEFDFANGTFSLLPYTGFGEVMSNHSGEVTFIKEKCLTGSVVLQYELCSTTCPDLCDEATLTIDVQADPTEDCSPEDVPNAITPNGDGVNDTFVFDLLLNSLESYPDNEIIIFNRWGDQVYHAKPYNNDWNGTNMNGKDLPQATYYYILRLNIADGVILRGDVSILK